MPQSPASNWPSFGRIPRQQPIEARAGVPIQLRAHDSLGEIRGNESIIWRVDGSQLTGEVLSWTFARPGRYTVRLDTTLGRSAVILINVALKLRDLDDRRKALDFFYC